MGPPQVDLHLSPLHDQDLVLDGLPDPPVNGRRDVEVVPALVELGIAVVDALRVHLDADVGLDLDQVHDLHVEAAGGPLAGQLRPPVHLQDGGLDDLARLVLLAVQVEGEGAVWRRPSATPGPDPDVLAGEGPGGVGGRDMDAGDLEVGRLQPMAGLLSVQLQQRVGDLDAVPVPDVGHRLEPEGVEEAALLFGGELPRAADDLDGAGLADSEAATNNRNEDCDDMDIHRKS